MNTMKPKKLSISLLLCIMLLLFVGCGNHKQADFENVSFGDSEGPEFFVYNDGMQVYFEQISFDVTTSSLKEEKAEIYLSKDEGKALIELLNPYSSNLTTDVLKSDFMRSYIVKLDDSTTLQIDADCNYPDKDHATYMFVMHHQAGVVIQGTYVDASIAEYLADKMN